MSWQRIICGVLGVACILAAGLALHAVDFERVFIGLDRDSNNILSINEAPRGSLFIAWDLDADAFVTRPELSMALARMKNLDLNGDGWITSDEVTTPELFQDMAGGADKVSVASVTRLHELQLGLSSDEPDIVLLTHLLGGFKGIVVDLVWLRAESLQQENKFWELYQLYDWVGKLEPHMEEIWTNRAWNMAYNLVAEMPDSEGRWQWIERGLDMLRFQGLKYNPRSSKIMSQMAWIYWHKIGRDTDNHNAYYKHRLALIMNSIVGGDRSWQDVNAWAAAPMNVEKLLDDEDVQKALTAMKIERSDKRLKTLVDAPFIDPSDWLFGTLLINRRHAGARKMLNFVTARLLRENLKMDRFEIMVKMEEEFGKFDWRLPEPIGMYWARLAVDMDPAAKNRIDYDRQVLTTLQETMRRGIITYLPGSLNEPMPTTLDLSKVAAVDDLYQTYFKRYSGAQNVDYGADSMRDGHETFLQEAAFTLYFAGYVEEARKYYMERKRRYDKPADNIPMEDWLTGRVKGLVDEFGTAAKVKAFVQGLILQTCRYTALGQPDLARQNESLARRAWEAFCEYDILSAAEGKARTVKAGLPTFSQLEAEVVRGILLGQVEFPPYLVPALRRVLNIPEGQEIPEEPVGRGITSPIAPTSPPPT